MKRYSSLSLIKRTANKIINTGVDFDFIPNERHSQIPQVNFFNVFNSESLKRKPQTTPPPVYFPIGNGGGA